MDGLLLLGGPPAWPWWADRMRAYLELDASVGKPRYVDIMYAAADRPPGNCFRRDLDRMSVAEWSKLCVLAFPSTPPSTVPVWAFVAGLRALGFGSRLLRDAAGFLSDKRGKPTEPWYPALIDTAAESPPPGFILVMREDATSIAATADYRPERVGERTGTPVLALPESQLDLYSDALAWLKEHGAVTRLVYEIDEDELPE